MIINSFKKLSLVDYPGKLAFRVFLVGSNFRCPYDLNPELILEQEIQKHLPIPEKEFFKFLKEKRKFIEACVLTGGEPTIHQDLSQFCQRIKKLGYQIKLDTNGFNPEMLRGLIKNKLVDYVAMDIKAPKEKYLKVIGFENSSCHYLLSKVQESINILKQDKIDYEFRTTVAPKALTKKDVLKIAHWLRPAKKYVLENFRPGKTLNPIFQNIAPYPEEFLISLQQTLSPFFDTVQIR